MKQVLLVTGGGRGIGAATALLAGQRGYAVAVNYAADAASASSVVERIRAGGGQALAVQADVSEEAQVLAMYARIDQELGPLTALVNNAGVVDSTQRVDEQSLARWQRMFAINVFGTLLCSREAVKRMSTKHGDTYGGGKGGVIVNLSSVAARLGGAGQYVDYAAAKGAVDVFTLGLAREVATEGIRVNAVRPGVIDTDIHASGGQPDRAQRMASAIPMQRPGTASEIAQAIVWLLSHEASYATGAVLDVSGGR
ncbi:sugar dehydrogenase [Hylemonella gracilis str. Niagara R]|uniref:Sugar dehydrogenase n=1 Tax=Hylemonella gracilis str. Niagara R TaxID=1458275 RepID=A0A016XDT6_9BURK|nr:SDR family oxidoreductase [Hylemonella gracilis]EYC49747.1 sugar dehydrogenase [Hylemonella gracilis str. Niagara R]